MEQAGDLPVASDEVGSAAPRRRLWLSAPIVVVSAVIVLAVRRRRPSRRPSASPDDAGVALVEVFGEVGDVLSALQDRLAAEGHLSTAHERGWVVALDVSDRHVSGVEDGSLREPAAGSVDTSPRCRARSIAASVGIRGGVGEQEWVEPPSLGDGSVPATRSLPSSAPLRWDVCADSPYSVPWAVARRCDDLEADPTLVLAIR